MAKPIILEQDGRRYEVVSDNIAIIDLHGQAPQLEVFDDHLNSHLIEMRRLMEGE